MSKVKINKNKQKLPLVLAIRKIRAIKSDLINAQNSDSKSENKSKDGFDLNDLDQMFDDIKKAKREKASLEAKKNQEQENQTKKRRFTSDGLPIYTEEELGMNNPKAGTTPLCPFDCDCCH